MNLLNNPGSEAEQDRVRGCYNKIEYVRHIGDFLKNKRMTINGDGIFDQVNAKGCNGLSIDKVFQYLLGLYIEGCMAVVSAEILEYGNESTSFQTECEVNLRTAKEKRNEIYNTCARESCSVVSVGITPIMKEVTGSKIIAKLRQVSPWFQFVVIMFKNDAEVNLKHGDCLTLTSKSKITRVLIWSFLKPKSLVFPKSKYITYKTLSVGFITNDMGLVNETNGEYTSLIGPHQTKQFCNKNENTDKEEGGFTHEITKEETVTLPRWGYALIVIGVLIFLLPGIAYYIYRKRKDSM